MFTLAVGTRCFYRNPFGTRVKGLDSRGVYCDPQQSLGTRDKEFALAVALFVVIRLRVRHFYAADACYIGQSQDKDLHWLLHCSLSYACAYDIFMPLTRVTFICYQLFHQSVDQMTFSYQDLTWKNASVG